MLRYTWYVLLAIIAVVAGGVQLDRHAYVVPAYEHLVPTAFDNFSLARRAVQEAKTGSAQRAIIDARELVLKHPIPAESLTILAIAELRNGKQELGSKALMLSAQRGWREPLTQRAVAMAAAQAGEWDVAADRLVALWKTSSRSQEVRELSAMLMEHPDMQTRFASKLADQANWPKAFVIWAWRSLSPEIFVKMVEEANSSGAKFDCSQMSAKARNLLGRGNLSLADALWRSQCGAENISSKNSLAFVQPGVSSDTEKDPFSWIYPPKVGLVIDFQSNSSGVGLNFENTEPLRQLLAQKYMALLPGRYTIRVIADSLGNAPRPILVSFACKGERESRAFHPVTSNTRNGPIVIDIPAEGCKVQMIQLRVAKGRGRGVQVVIN